MAETVNWLKGRKPQVQVTQLQDDLITFVLSGTDVSMANALRRAMLSEVPTIAMDVVTLIENTSVLHDEFLVHRIGLLPIDSRRAPSFNFRDECPCADQCMYCCVNYALNMTCVTDEPLTVTHLDIKPESQSPDTPLPVPLASYDSQSPVHGIPIVKLRKNQTINLRLTAIKGVGKVHAKWIPVATSVYHFEPRVRINYKLANQLSVDEKKMIADASSDNTIVFEDDTARGGNGILSVGDVSRCNFCNECEDKARELGYKDLFQIEEDESRFFFTVEGTGALPPAQIVTAAFEVLDKKISEIQKGVHEAQETSCATPESTIIPSSSKTAHQLMDFDFD